MTWHAQPLVDNGDGLFAEVAKSHAKRNCLIVGPAGSGKLSLARGLAALTNSRSRKFLFDWEVEQEAQHKLLADVANRLQLGIKSPEVWIQRRIHLVESSTLATLLHKLQALQAKDDHLVTCYATSESAAIGEHSAHELERLFPVTITLGDGGYAHGAFDSILSCALASLRRKYGRGAIAIEPEAARHLEDLARHTTMPAMLSALERTFVFETGPALTLTSLQHAQTTANGPKK